MSISVETEVTTLKFEFVNSPKRYDVVQFAGRIWAVNTLLEVAAWNFPEYRQPHMPSNTEDFSEYVNGLAESREAVRSFDVMSVSYQSPLWLTIASITSSSAAISYTVYQHFNRFVDARDRLLDLRSKKSDVVRKEIDTRRQQSSYEVEHLANQLLMDNMNFNHAQRRAVESALARRRTKALEELEEESDDLKEVANRIETASILLNDIESLEYQEG